MSSQINNKKKNSTVNKAMSRTQQTKRTVIPINSISKYSRANKYDTFQSQQNTRLVSAVSLFIYAVPPRRRSISILNYIMNLQGGRGLSFTYGGMEKLSVTRLGYLGTLFAFWWSVDIAEKVYRKRLLKGTLWQLIPDIYQPICVLQKIFIFTYFVDLTCQRGFICFKYEEASG